MTKGRIKELAEIAGLVAAGRVLEHVVRRGGGESTAKWIRRGTNAAIEVTVAEHALKRKDGKK